MVPKRGAEDKANPLIAALERFAAAGKKTSEDQQRPCLITGAYWAWLASPYPIVEKIEAGEYVEFAEFPPAEFSPAKGKSKLLGVANALLEEPALAHKLAIAVQCLSCTWQLVCSN